MILCWCVVGQKGWTTGGRAKIGRRGGGVGGIRGMASVASEADRSLAKVSIAILAVCMLTT